MAKDLNYTLLVDGQAKRMNTDLKRLQLIAAEYMHDEHELIIRCPQFSGSGAQSARLNYNKVTQTWDKMQS